ncbi:Alpha/Beta hydrolase protein [Dactylonectria macrodidyma]|uniref:Carboxypeptidase n=1 Tax=Dactylonectria macrodidyma TaxID=307937 RepID=A0A9P9JN40_9HYPO|nr:Alpha/Beta hydrolase protein [Dactylonectria macrodidyma]
MMMPHLLRPPLLSLLLLAPFFAPASLAQFIPSTNAAGRNLTVVRSPGNTNVTVSYKVPEGACTTAFESQRQYTGWVSIPGDYPTNLFFWFVEARQETESLTIWLNGGPGSSSMYGFFTGNGPCEVVEKGLNRYDTVAREWGWDRASNMLFIDQPNQVGFSYDVPTNGTLNFGDDSIAQPPIRNRRYPDWVMANGTFSSGEGSNTSNTTELAAEAVWHMVQGFLTTFPQYQPAEDGRNGSIGVNLFAESYGGRYGPIFAETFEEKNLQREAGELPLNTTVDIHLSSLGIVNGCVDMEVQTPYYPIFASDNTYGYQAISSEESAFYVERYSSEGGCKELLQRCGASVTFGDPDGDGDNANVNDVCSQASEACLEIEYPYFASGRSAYDLSAPDADPFPSMLFHEYLNQASIQKAIGAPVNYTMSNNAVYYEFAGTGDQARDGNIPRLAALVNKGIHVGLMYGDRDYICNWMGGEAVSKEIAIQAGGEYATRFSTAGYAPIIVNDSYIGGVVRQFGNLSFSRIYQAGHAVPAYQPETAFQVFARIILDTSVSTGEDIDISTYNTTGPVNATQTDKLPRQREPTCFVRDYSGTCNDDAKSLFLGDDPDNEGVVINGVLYSSSQDWPLATEAPTTTSASTSASETLTGVYTATTTPADADSAGVSLRSPSHLVLVLGIAMVLALQALLT